MCDSAKYSVESLNEDQRRAYDLLSSSTDNFYVTGKAGTGKSYLLQTFVHNSKENIPIVAPTGIAAINVGGQTIHSFFGLDIGIQAVSDKNAVERNTNKERLNGFNTLIIDEVSMVRVDVMDMIDAKLKYARGNTLPFGGCQIIVFGDLYQLPPVVEGDETVSGYFTEMYKTAFFFGAPVLLEKPFQIIELNQIMRQKDPEFIDILNSIREGNNSQAILDKLNSKNIERPKDTECISIVTTNNAANKINHSRLEQLTNDEFVYRGVVQGDFALDELPTNMILQLKVGAQIMLLKNNRPHWVNGTIGVVTFLSETEIRVGIPFTDKSGNKQYVEHSVDKETWEKYKYQYNSAKHIIEKVRIGSFTQYPIKLAYAITVHKSQGQTYDSVEIDYSQAKAFSAGQTYVALSRCKNFSSLYLKSPLSPDDIKANQEVTTFMKGEFVPKPRSVLAIPIVTKHQTRSEFTWREDNRIEAKDYLKHKKITGTRLPNVLNLVDKISPFAMWCAMIHVYEEPYKETIWTKAGQIIEPKQFEYVKKVFAKEGRVFVSPTDRYGEDYKTKTRYDFFQQFEQFGGMWDYLMESDDKTVMVFEMKTTGVGNKQYWSNNIPTKYVLQAALYAWMLGIDHFCMVCSFLKNSDYEKPEEYVCDETNTLIRPMQISKKFPEFDTKVIARAIQWWEDFIETGISPEYDEERDKPILAQLREYTLQQEEDDYYDDLAKKHAFTEGHGEYHEDDNGWLSQWHVIPN